MTRHPLFIASLIGLSSCAQSEKVTADWELVGVYDSSAIGHQIDVEAVPYLWVPSPGMTKSCGPAKSPDGLGLFEAEVMANQLSPTLAILLKRGADNTAPLVERGVTVALGVENPEFILRPAVKARHMAIRIEGEGSINHKQQVRTQLQMELCLEHKTGRAWAGGSEHQLRQAFLLDPQDAGGIDRRYYGGQRDPIAPLLGPSDACLVRNKSIDGQPQAGGRGEGSLDLVPSDVWGASLRFCGIEEGPGSTIAKSVSVPLSLGEVKSTRRATIPLIRSDLLVTINEAELEPDVTVSVHYNDTELLKNSALFPPSPDPKKPPGTTDILGQIPLEYPLLGAPNDPERYALLLIPNWQLVEGIRRFNRGNFDEAMPSGGQGILDGVGWLLDHPEHLFVQLPAHTETNEVIWMNVAAPLAGGPGGLLHWGYTPGTLSGREPIALFGVSPPSWSQVREAHRTSQHSFFLLSGFLLSPFILLGIGRMRDLWTSVPEERVVFWPGTVADDQETEAPELPEGGGEDE